MEKELLDFCRVKKIFDKGYGFLSSIKYPQDVFFHFSKIKDESIKNKLFELKRGVVYIYYTSSLIENKRKLTRMWLDFKNVPSYLKPEFMLKVIDEFKNGKTNTFELAYIIKQLRDESLINRANFEMILSSKVLVSNPSIVINMLSSEDQDLIGDLKAYFDKISNEKTEYHVWSEDLLNKLYK